MLKDRSIICFGGEDWWYHHPHSKNDLMRIFARAGNKVIFVNSISMGLPSLTNKDILPKIGRKLKSYAKLARKTEEGITVISPATIPFYGNAATRKINQKLLELQISLLAKKNGLTKPILWIAIPLAIQTVLIFALTYAAAKWLKLPYEDAAPAAMIGASNHFEVAIATAVMLFGLSSGAALATVVGVLIEVPIMLLLVKVCQRTKGWFDANKPG